MTLEEFRELKLGNRVRLLVTGSPFPQGSIGIIEDGFGDADGSQHWVICWQKFPVTIHPAQRDLLEQYLMSWYSERDAKFLERVVRKRRQ